MNNVEILQVQWSEMEAALRQIRTMVFIEEQHVPPEMEWETVDESCVHLLARQGEEFIGTSRLLDTGQIGRMAVLKPHRNLGVGSKLLLRLLSIARLMEMKEVFLNSQLEALGFYAKHGFRPEGRVFEEAGILHRRMHMALAKNVQESNGTE